MIISVRKSDNKVLFDGSASLPMGIFHAQVSRRPIAHSYVAVVEHIDGTRRSGRGVTKVAAARDAYNALRDWETSFSETVTF